MDSIPMNSFKTNDGVNIKYQDIGDPLLPPLILIHGFTGSSEVWKRNIPDLGKQYRIIAPDLRGHGDSDKPEHGFQVDRLAMDLYELINHLGFRSKYVSAIGGSLGCAILWSYCTLFTSAPFTHLVFVDQSPLQNLDLTTGWSVDLANLACNNASALAHIRSTLLLAPEAAHNSTISACLSYFSHPSYLSNVNTDADTKFFFDIAMKGDGGWYGKLMADHTAKDHRDNIVATLGPESGSATKVLVVASSKSGCFRPQGPMSVVNLVNHGTLEVFGLEKRLSNASVGSERAVRARGVVVDWGGHWCYWEDPEKFNELVLEFLKEERAQ